MASDDEDAMDLDAPPPMAPLLEAVPVHWGRIVLRWPTAIHVVEGEIIASRGPALQLSHFELRSADVPSVVIARLLVKRADDDQWLVRVALRQPQEGTMPLKIRLDPSVIADTVVEIPTGDAFTKVFVAQPRLLPQAVPPAPSTPAWRVYVDSLIAGEQLKLVGSEWRYPVAVAPRLPLEEAVSKYMQLSLAPNSPPVSEEEASAALCFVPDTPPRREEEDSDCVFVGESSPRHASPGPRPTTTTAPPPAADAAAAAAPKKPAPAATAAPREPPPATAAPKKPRPAAAPREPPTAARSPPDAEPIALQQFRDLLKENPDLQTRLDRCMARVVQKYCPVTTFEVGQRLLADASLVIEGELASWGQVSEELKRAPPAACAFFYQIMLQPEEGSAMRRAIFGPTGLALPIAPADNLPVFVDIAMACECLVLCRATATKDWEELSAALPHSIVSDLWRHNRAAWEAWWPTEWFQPAEPDSDSEKHWRKNYRRAMRDVDHVGTRAEQVPLAYQKAVAVDLVHGEYQLTEGEKLERMLVFSPGMGKTMTYLLYALAANSKRNKEAKTGIYAPASLVKSGDWQGEMAKMGSVKKEIRLLTKQEQDLGKDIFFIASGAEIKVLNPAIMLEMQRLAVDEAQNLIPKEKKNAAAFPYTDEQISRVLITGTPSTTDTSEDLERFRTRFFLRTTSLAELRRNMYTIVPSAWTRPAIVAEPVPIDYDIDEADAVIHFLMGVKALEGKQSLDPVGLQYLLSPILVDESIYFAIRDDISDNLTTFGADGQSLRAACLARLDEPHPERRIHVLAERLKERVNDRGTILLCPNPKKGDAALKIHHRNILIFSTRTNLSGDTTGDTWMKHISTQLTNEKLPHKTFYGVEKAAAWKVAAANTDESATEPVILFLNYKSGGVGVNLQQADTVVLYDETTVAATSDQALARALRIGQLPGRVRVYTMCARVLHRPDVETLDQLSQRRRQRRGDQWMDFVAAGAAPTAPANDGATREYFVEQLKLLGVTPPASAQ